MYGIFVNCYVFYLDAGSSGNDSSEPNASDPGAAYKLHVSASSGSQQQNVLRSGKYVVNNL